MDYNPTTFLIYPDYSQTRREDVEFLPERITVVKMELTKPTRRRSRQRVGSTRAPYWNRPSSKP